MTITLYGINNCDTIRKAKRWLEDRDIDYQFHDYRKDGISTSQISSWADELGWETLLNKRSTSWRNLDNAQRDAINISTAITLMSEQPTLIKRPLLDIDGAKLIGFDESQYSETFSK